jgi:hypothetical protein
VRGKGGLVVKKGETREFALTGLQVRKAIFHDVAKRQDLPNGEYEFRVVVDDEDCSSEFFGTLLVTRKS